MAKAKALRVISYLWIGSMVGAALAFFTQLLLARQLGPSRFGVFTATMAVVTLVVPIAGAGVAQFWLLVFGAEGRAGSKWIQGSVRLVFFATSMAFLGLIVWSLLTSDDSYTLGLKLVLSFSLFGMVFNEILMSKLQLDDKYLKLAVWQFLPHVSRFILVVVFVVWLPDLDLTFMVAIGYAFVSFLISIYSVREIRDLSRGSVHLDESRGGSLSSSMFKSSGEVLARSWPFCVAALFYFIYFQSDIVLVKHFSGDKQAGLYSVAFTVLAAIYILPNVIYQKFLLPKIHRWAAHDREKFFSVYRKGNFAMLFLGLVVMFVGWAVLPALMIVFFGNQYADAIDYMNILLWSVPIVFVASSAGAVLVTSDHMRTKLKFMGVIAVLNLTLNLVLIPDYGALGASYVTVLSNFLLMLLYLFGAEKLVFGKV